MPAHESKSEKQEIICISQAGFPGYFGNNGTFMKKTAFALLCFVLLLAACDASKEASNDNFEKAINAHFARTCVNISPENPGGSWRAPDWPVILAADAGENGQKRAQQSYAPLVRAGLLKVTDGTARPDFASPLDAQQNSRNATVPAKVYSLTEAGKKALASPDGTGDGRGGFCAGHYAVDNIVRFTQPVNTGSATVTQVSYTFSPVGVADWAKSGDVTQVYPELENKFVAHQSDVTTLVLANDGWIEMNDFNPSAFGR